MSEKYLRYDPFDGDRDVNVRCRTVKMAVTRTNQVCHNPVDGKPHAIPAGTRVRYEKALVDGEWGAYRVCIPCMDRWFTAVGS